MTEHQEEKVKLAVQDAQLLSQLSQALEDYAWQVGACGSNDTRKIDDRITALSIRVIKEIANRI